MLVNTKKTRKNNKKILKIKMVKSLTFTIFCAIIEMQLKEI